MRLDVSTIYYEVPDQDGELTPVLVRDVCIQANTTPGSWQTGTMWFYQRNGQKYVPLFALFVPRPEFIGGRVAFSGFAQDAADRSLVSDPDSAMAGFMPSDPEEGALAQARLVVLQGRYEHPEVFGPRLDGLLDRILEIWSPERLALLIEGALAAASLEAAGEVGRRVKVGRKAAKGG